jgi:drug/metabolite transporter (DMT)-like permease
MADSSLDVADQPDLTRLAAQRPVRGILLVVLALMSFSCSDCCAKYLSTSLPSVEIAWLRYASFTALAIIAVIASGRAPVTRRPVLACFRGLAMFGSAIFFIMALGRMPIADATATSFSSPLIITLLAILVLGEKIPPWRWVMLGLGVVGMLLIVRPGTSTFNPAAIFALLCALSWATGAVITRKMHDAEIPLTLLFYTAIAGFIVSTALLPFVWQPPTPAQWVIGTTMGCCTTLAHWLVIRAHRHAGASVLAPFSYTQLLWSTLFGMLLFGTVPGAMTLTGAGIIIATGLYGYFREHMSGRKA